jgi:hypothetical protein
MLDLIDEHTRACIVVLGGIDGLPSAAPDQQQTMGNGDFSLTPLETVVILS